MNFFGFVIVLYIVLAILAFGKLPETFFQQDEWAIFGTIIYADKIQLSLFDRLFVYEQRTHLVPFTNALTLLEYRFYGLNFVPFAITSIVLHLINALLVFVLTNVLLKKKWLAVLAGGIFLINSIPHQAITWIATVLGTAGTTTILLLSLVSFGKYLAGRERNWRLLLVSLMLFFFSLGFKETSIFAFLVYPLFWFVFSQRRSLRGAIKILLPLGVFGTLYILIRFYFFTTFAPAVTAQPELAQPSLSVYLFRIVALPIRVLAQSFVPVPFILKGARVLVLLAYPHFVIDHTPDPYVVESVAADILSFFIFCVILVVRFFVQRRKNRNVTRLIDVSLIFIAMSALPFIVVPGMAGYLSLIDGRHLYLTGIFSTVLFATVIYTAVAWLRKKRFAVLSLILFIGLVGTYHIAKIRKDIAYQVVLAKIRLPILEQIASAYPTLPRNVIFYVISDTPYYGLPYEEPIVPFQSGFGQTLLVWYNAHGQILPACFFERKFLYPLLSEDYKECSGRGFGYARKYDTLHKFITENDLTVNNVIAFSWNSKTSEFRDVTSEVRMKLSMSDLIE